LFIGKCNLRFRQFAADELRRIPVEKPPGLVTTEPGLATAAPEQLKLDEASEKPAEPAPAAN